MIVVRKYNIIFKNFNQLEELNNSVDGWYEWLWEFKIVDAKSGGLDESYTFHKGGDPGEKIDGFSVYEISSNCLTIDSPSSQFLEIQSILIEVIDCVSEEAKALIMSGESDKKINILGSELTKLREVYKFYEKDFLKAKAEVINNNLIEEKRKEDWLKQLDLI